MGGAGYIGSHMCRMLAEAGHAVTVIDDLSTGHSAAVQWGKLVQCSIANRTALETLFIECSFDAVIHFAGAIVVSESVSDPLKYYEANVSGTLNLIHAMRRAGTSRFVFSSTAAIFGEPCQDLIEESHPIAPINPYGHSKAMIEQVLRDSARAYGIRAVALRYFNAAGADPSGLIGEAHEPETHLIPRLLELAVNPSAAISIYGDDHDTPDGTCIRDYVYVNDLCAAHMLALGHLASHDGFHAFNLGNGLGFSVREVLRAVESVTGACLNPQIGPRREGDPARLVACSDLARSVLGWTPSIPDLHAIVATAWRWHRARRY